MSETAAETETETAPRSARPELTEAHLRVVRTGHGANCSSIGSVIDTLFATATVGAAVFAAVLGALRREDIRIVGDAPSREPEPKPASPEIP